MKKTFFIVACLIIVSTFSACKKKETVIPPDPIEDEYSNAGFNFDFIKVDPKINLTLDAYIKTYEDAVNQDGWPYNNYYSLKNLNILIFAYDKDAKNFDAVYMIVPPNGDYPGDVSDVYQTSNIASDGTKVIRVKDKKFLEDIIKVRLTGSPFGTSTLNDIKYQYFFFEKSEYDIDMQPLDIMRAVGFIIHECFHQTVQLEFTNPYDEYKSLRFRLPPDYPADTVSFSLIASGIKMYETILFDDVQDVEEYMKMYYVLFKKLRELDTSGKNYIDGFYLFECWLEGGAEFPEYYMELSSGVMDGSIPEIRYDNSYQEFTDIMEKEIEAGVPPTVILNGEEVVVYYAHVVETTYYKLGSATLFLIGIL